METAMALIDYGLIRGNSVLSIFNRELIDQLYNYAKVTYLEVVE